MVLGAVVAEKPALKQVTHGKHDIVKLVHALGDDVIGKERQSGELGSLFVDAQLNGQSVRFMVDTDATHNFVSEAKAKSLRLVFGPSSSVLKTVNAKPTNVKGIARNVQLNLGAWQGNVSFFFASLDVFDLVLWLDYWDAVKAFICPFLNQIYIYDPRGPCVVPAVRVTQVVSLLSAIQIVKGFKEEGAPVLAVGTGTKEVKRDKALTPSEQRVLKGKDFILWAKPHAMGQYMAPQKLEDSRKQRGKLLGSRHVSPLKAPCRDKGDMERRQSRRPTIFTNSSVVDKKVETIIKHRVIQGVGWGNSSTQFLVRWKGQPIERATWEKYEALWPFKDQVHDYLNRCGAEVVAISSGGECSDPHIFRPNLLPKELPNEPNLGAKDQKVFAHGGNNPTGCPGPPRGYFSSAKSHAAQLGRTTVCQDNHGSNMLPAKACAAQLGRATSCLDEHGSNCLPARTGPQQLDKSIGTWAANTF
nr:uncharacterized protein LOC117278617 isoform X1 [Nicotiana tomentosiformis]XP_033513998.1 uncharacterized protein LOC117278617 isoform X2 [Nicotiana tomentosiformis]